MSSTATLSITNQDATQNSFDVTGTITVTSGSYPTNGIPVTWAAVQVSNPTPRKNSTRFSGLKGFVYVYDDTHGTLRIFQTGTAANDPLNEVSTTTPSNVVSDTISVFVKFDRA
jgi:hypothetical protein